MHIVSLSDYPLQQKTQVSNLAGTEILSIILT